MNRVRLCTELSGVSGGLRRKRLRRRAAARLGGERRLFLPHPHARVLSPAHDPDHRFRPLVPGQAEPHVFHGLPNVAGRKPFESLRGVELARRSPSTCQIRAVKHFPLGVALEPPSDGPSNVPSPRFPSCPISPPMPRCIASRSTHAASLAVVRFIPQRPRLRVVRPPPSSDATSAAQRLAGSPTIATSCPPLRSLRGRLRSQRWRRSTWWFRSRRVSGYSASSLCDPRRMSSRTSEPRLR